MADTGLLTWNLAITVVIGFLVGFRPHGSAVGGILRTSGYARYRRR